MEKTYYAVEEAAVKGKTLNDGRDAWDTLVNLPDVLITDYGEVYLPEAFVLKETDPFCRWLNEQNAINPHPKKIWEPENSSVFRLRENHPCRGACLETEGVPGVLSFCRMPAS